MFFALNFIKNQKFKRIFEIILPDLLLWIIIVLLLIFTQNWSKYGVRPIVRELIYVFGPIVIFVYLHSFLFYFFFLKKKYVIYFTLILCLFSIFYFIVKWIFINYVPHRNDDILFTLFFYSIMYIGFRYLINAPKEIIQIKEIETKRIKAELDLQEMEAKHSRAELEVLKSQLNPHFLFNSLNNIYSLTMIDAEKAGQAILTLSDLMRYNLESSKKKYVTLQSEVEFIENYINLERLRLDENSNIILHKEGDFQRKTIAPMILISFVENCFKHGISANEQNNFVNVHIQLKDSILVFITKNKIALKRIEIQQKDVAIGIKNVKRRLELLYPNKYELNINSENEIYTVYLKIIL